MSGCPAACRVLHRGARESPTYGGLDTCLGRLISAVMSSRADGRRCWWPPSEGKGRDRMYAMWPRVRCLHRQTQTAALVNTSQDTYRSRFRCMTRSEATGVFMRFARTTWYRYAERFPPFAEQAETAASRVASATTALRAPRSGSTEGGLPVLSQETDLGVRT